MDPGFWVVAELDEEGLPKPYTFAVPLQDLVPATPTGRGPWHFGDPAKGVLLRAAVSLAAAASFALGAVSLIGHQPATPIAEGLRFLAAAQIPDAPALGGSPPVLANEPSGSFLTESWLVRSAALGSSTDAFTEPLSGTDGLRRGTTGGGGTGGGGRNGGGGGGGTHGGGSGGGGNVAKPDTNPGNSGSAPGHNSTPGNSGSSNGNSGSSHGNSGSAPGHSGSAPGHN
jgi:hypothetical protein